MWFGSDWQVQYRCQYREYWYEDCSMPDPDSALQRAMQVAAWGRRARVLDPHGRVAWDSSSGPRLGLPYPLPHGGLS